MDIRCMEPVSILHVVTGQGFIHQIKWDGIRGICLLENGRIELYTKKGIRCTEAYPELQDLAKNVEARKAVLDGELVVFARGKPSFYHVLRRGLTKKEVAIEHLAKQYPVRYIVFDMLFLEGDDLRPRPLEERQEELKRHFINSSVAALTDSFEDGKALFELVKQKNMEGIVSKRLGSEYIAGKNHGDWYKTKVIKKLLCVVAGIQLKNSLPASLVIGVYRDGKLSVIGAVSSGLKQDDWMLIKEYMRKEKTGEEKEIIWIRPALTCWVRFTEWTEHGTLRNPVLLGFSGREAVEATGEELNA